ncbi:MAG: rhamnogalacturonan acetylesterase [Opitutales bacterium]
MRPLRLASLVVLALAGSPSPAFPQSAASAPLQIVITGDSTVSNYDLKGRDRGWGMFVEERFKPGTVVVTNLAAPGRSTKTFVSEKRWAKALAAKPSYVFIQFGHNDSHDPRNREATDFASDYKERLRRFIDESRAIGAVPILVSPMVRRQFDARGKVVDAPPPSRPLSAYANAMKEVALEKKAAFIDLHASSRVLVEKMGPEGSAAFANKKGDATHFNEKGARAMADLVFDGLPSADPKLASLMLPGAGRSSKK